MKRLTLVFREVDRDKYQMLVDGRKTVETRAATVKYRGLEAGDEIIAKCGPDKHVSTIVKSRHFTTVDELFKAYDYRQILPSAKNLQEAKDMYSAFPGYKVKIAKFGIMAFEIA